MAQTIRADWLAVEWFEGRLQIWTMQGANALETVHGEVAGNSIEGVANVLSRLTATWALPDRPPVWIAGLPIGIGATPRKVPCNAIADQTYSNVQDGFDLQVIPGLCQSAPSGLLQGAETRIAGFLSLNKDWDGVICLPGETTVWAQVSAGEVVSFQNFLTGELIAVLGGDGPDRADTAVDDTAFDEALSDGLSRPERLAARLASLRAERVLTGLPAPTAQARLAGTLIGAELAAARPYWLGQTLAVIGTGAAASLYLRALSQQGAPATQADGARMALAGITAVRRAAQS